ncbi:Signal peptide peptidase-like 2A [Sparganum proliferum]
MSTMAFILLLILSILTTDIAYADHIYSPAALNLTDIGHGDLGIMCAFELQPDASRGVVLPHTYFLVDIRDVNLNSSSDPQTIGLVKQRLKDAIANFPSAFAAADAIGVVTTVDPTGMYDVLLAGDISLIMAVTTNVSYVVSPLIDTSKLRFALTVSSTLDLLLSKRSNGTSASGLLVSIHDSKGPSLHASVLAFVILKILSLSSILLAAVIVMRNHEYLLKLLQQMRSEDVKHPVLNTILPFIFIICSVAVILLAYFFFDIMVYVFITLFVIAGASSMAGVLSTFIFDCAPRLTAYSITVCRKEVQLVRLGLFFPCLAFTIAWCVFRNDPDIGWIMQDIIGVFLVAHILTDISALLSFKAITIGFLVFVCYDIFFVFVTPLFTKATATSSNSILSSNAHEILSRVPRSTESVMEAVATGSAGVSGEKMPLLFKVSTGSLFPSLTSLCSRGNDFMLLGFGDAILPGALCVFMAFYDACWKMKFPHHLAGAVVGYCMGGLLVATVLFTTKSAQPALLYLCPMTLGFTILSASPSRRTTRTWILSRILPNVTATQSRSSIYPYPFSSPITPLSADKHDPPCDPP